MEINATALEWGVASLPLAGESESGDRCVVAPFDAGALVAVIDALGHGPEAAYAAGVAAKVLEADAREKPGALFLRCHELMRSTRGAAISAAFFDWPRGTMTWLGVGNVMGVIVRADVSVNPRVKQMVVHGGVIGYQLRDMQPLVVEVAPGDLLILATDGVRRDFTEILPAALKPQVLVFHCGDEG